MLPSVILLPTQVAVQKQQRAKPQGYRCVHRQPAATRRTRRERRTAECGEGPGKIAANKMPTLANAVYGKCDATDGLKDGLIDDHGYVQNDETIAVLTKQALVHAAAGAEPEFVRSLRFWSWITVRSDKPNPYARRHPEARNLVEIS